MSTPEEFLELFARKSQGAAPKAALGGGKSLQEIVEAAAALRNAGVSNAVNVAEAGAAANVFGNAGLGKSGHKL